MAADVGVLTRGKLPQGVQYTSPWSPSSPWSLALAFMPETVPPKQYVAQLDAAPLSAEGEPLDADVALYCTENNQRLGWIEPGPATLESVAQQFMQCRIRQQDAAFGSIKWDSSAKYVASSWYNGIIRPLTLLRDSYNSTLTLAKFESMSADNAFAQLAAPVTPSTASHVVKYILEPWCEYTQHQDRLTQWAAQLPLDVCLKLTSISSLGPSLVEACYSAPFDSKRLLELSDRLEDNSLKSDVEAGIILHSESLNQVRALRNGPDAAKLDMLHHFIVTYPSPMVGVWEALEKLPLPSGAAIEPMIVRELIHRGHFETLQSKRYSRDLVQTEALEYLNNVGGNESDLARLTGASALLADQFLNKRYSAVDQLVKQYGLDPKHTLASNGKQVLHDVLLHNQRAYQKKDLVELINLATNNSLDKNYALGQLVEFALVDNNFNAATQFCAQLDRTSDFAWLAFLQSAKYRPSFSESVPPKIRAKQMELIVTCLEVCPATDIEGVLRAYEALNAAPASAATAAAQVFGTDIEQTRSASPDTRKHNLFVSSLGWAIGAPTE